ncbi:MAG: prepilin-type N-terminal cleavage/methylation domain-containing protein [bacterium]
MTSRTGSDGFTLIEVLVASVILFAGLGAVLKAYSLAVVAMEAAADKLAVCQVMDQKAAELDLQVSGSANVLPSGQGQQRVGGAAYLWRVQASREMLTPQLSVLSAAIEVARANRPQLHSYLCEWAQFQEKERSP